MADERAPCSVVLEGGVTSAVIYTTLLARLSRDHTFRQLGGASSGAVAAAAAAAAEYGRHNHQNAAVDPFELLRQFPTELKTPTRGSTRLFWLFQPKPSGRASFCVAMAALDEHGGGSWMVSARRVTAALFKNFSFAAALLTTIPLALLWLIACALPHVLSSNHKLALAAYVLGAVVAVLLACVLALILLLGWALFVTVGALRENHWGLCSGISPPDIHEPALTPELHKLFQGLSRPSHGGPLTFGDLWQVQTSASASEAQKPGRRGIDLQIITTAVSVERPIRLPGDPGDDPLREFFYDPEEWAELFPADIMAHLLAHARPAQLQRGDGKKLCALPDPKDWPVLMAARFSLSFPILLSAVPMYIAVRKPPLRPGDELTEDPQFEARKVYFSDGGITSNCPVHLFDAPLPRFPTFGVNLYRLPRGAPMCVSMWNGSDPELAAELKDAGAWKTPLPFLVQIFTTMFTWRDSLQRALPGYRERIVHVGLPPESGGLHLKMTSRTIELLASLGVQAAEQLHDAFSVSKPGRTNTWQSHQWVRARTSLTALRAYLAAFSNRAVRGNPDYVRLLRFTTPTDDRFVDETARQQSLDLVHGVDALMKAIDKTIPPDALDQNAPRPAPELHMSPPW